MKNQTRIVAIFILLSLVLCSCKTAPAEKHQAPEDIVRSYLIAVKNRHFEEADTCLLTQQGSYRLLSARSLFKETREFHFSERTLSALDHTMADYIFSIQRENIQNDRATVFVSLNTHDLKKTFDQVKRTVFEEARMTEAPLDTIILDAQVDPLLYERLTSEEDPRINTGVPVFLVKKNHRWLIDDQAPNNRAFFDALIGK